MKLKEMRFRGQRVYVEVDDDGAPATEKGRARMRYRVDADQVYRPSPANLEEVDGARVVEGAPGTVVENGPTKSAAPGAPIPEGAIVAYTDGACSGNPGPAGLGYVVRWPNGRVEQRGEPLGESTNNVAELTAILRVLELVEERDAPLLIHSDSTYSIGVLTQGWKAKANKELVAEIRAAVARFPRLELRKVKGHAGVPDNELVDELARTAAETQEETS